MTFVDTGGMYRKARPAKVAIEIHLIYSARGNMQHLLVAQQFEPAAQYIFQLLRTVSLYRQATARGRRFQCKRTYDHMPPRLQCMKKLVAVGKLLFMCSQKMKHRPIVPQDIMVCR